MIDVTVIYMLFALLFTTFLYISTAETPQMCRVSLLIYYARVLELYHHAGGSHASGAQSALMGVSKLSNVNFFYI